MWAVCRPFSWFSLQVLRMLHLFTGYDTSSGLIPLRVLLCKEARRGRPGVVHFLFPHFSGSWLLVRTPYLRDWVVAPPLISSIRIIDHWSRSRNESRHLSITEQTALFWTWNRANNRLLYSKLYILYGKYWSNIKHRFNKTFCYSLDISKCCKKDGLVDTKYQFITLSTINSTFIAHNALFN